MEIEVEIPEAEPVEVESYSIMVPFSSSPVTHRHAGSNLYAVISVYYSCDIGFNSALNVMCATSCLSSEFIEIDNLEFQARNVDIIPAATNTEYFANGHSIACSGIISQVGVVLNNATSCSTHNVLFSLLRNEKTLFRKVSTHSLSINAGVCPQDPTAYITDVEIAVSSANFISVSSVSANLLLFTEQNSGTIIYSRMGQLSSNAVLDLDSLTGRPNTQLLFSIRMQEGGEIN